MSSTPLRVPVGIVAGLFAAWALDTVFTATFFVHVSEPRSALHVPSWLEPFEQTARLLCDLVPAAIMGAIAAWRPALLGFTVALITFYSSALLPESRDAILSSWGFDHALTRAIMWAAGAMAGHYSAERWMLNKSPERTREA